MQHVMRHFKADFGGVVLYVRQSASEGWHATVLDDHKEVADELIVDFDEEAAGKRTAWALGEAYLREQKKPVPDREPEWAEIVRQTS